MERAKRLEPANAIQIDASTWRFVENALGCDVYMYLLLGTERALLIDTGYGFTDLPAKIRELTSLPLWVVNTHAHFDHMHGNHLFEAVFHKKTRLSDR